MILQEVSESENTANSFRFFQISAEGVGGWREAGGERWGGWPSNKHPDSHGVEAEYRRGRRHPGAISDVHGQGDELERERER